MPTIDEQLDALEEFAQRIGEVLMPWQRDVARRLILSEQADHEQAESVASAAAAALRTAADHLEALPVALRRTEGPFTLLGSRRPLTPELMRTEADHIDQVAASVATAVLVATAEAAAR